jgi:hypothetical protein
MRFIYNSFKAALFVSNALYFLISLGSIMFAVFLHFNPNQINEMIKEDFGELYIRLIYFFLLFGFFLFFVGIFGCIGVMTEKTWILTIYFGILFAIFSLQFSGAIYLYVLGIIIVFFQFFFNIFFNFSNLIFNFQKGADYFKQFESKVIHAIKYEYGKSQVHTRALDYIHYQFKCCGWFSPNDWLNSTYLDPKYAFKAHDPKPLNSFTSSPYSSLIPYKIPHSCCVINYDLTCILMHKFHENGCDETLKFYFNKGEAYTVSVLALLNLYQLVLLVLALYVICMLFVEKRRRSSEFLIHNMIDNQNYISNSHL